MVGAVQFGILLAGVVLFLPMGMAGWHLSRNKMLFFSGALFITLAVGVHLAPYISPISLFLSSISLTSSSPPRSPPSCLSFLNSIVWKHSRTSLNSSAPSWAWARSDPVRTCGFQRLSRLDSSDLLNGSWIVVAGDSQARLFVLSLLKLILASPELSAIERNLSKRHSDYQMIDEEHGMKLDFIWAPYESNLTDLLAGLKEKDRYPDLVVMGSGLWHMLHVNDASDYGRWLRGIRTAAINLLPAVPELGSDRPAAAVALSSLSLRPPRMFWLGMPTLVNALLNTEEKREKMSHSACEAYARELSESFLLRERGGPFLLLDVGLLSRNCGEQCAEDGMHYAETVYEAAVHIMLNALMVVSHQHV